MVRNLYISARICETRWGNSGFWLANNSRGGLTYIFSLPGSHQEHQEKKVSPAPNLITHRELSNRDIDPDANGYLVVKVPSFGRVRNVAGVKNEAQDSGFVEAETEEGKF